MIPESEIEEKPSIESLCQSIDSIISGQNQSQPENGLSEEPDTSQDTQELRERLQRLREPDSESPAVENGDDSEEQASSEVALPTSENLQVDSENNLSEISKVAETAQVENGEKVPSPSAESSRPETPEIQEEDVVENCDKNDKSPTPSEEVAGGPTRKTKPTKAPKPSKNILKARSVEAKGTLEKNTERDNRDTPEPNDQPAESNEAEDAGGSSDPKLVPEVPAAPVEKDVDLTLQTVIEDRPPPPPNRNTSVTASKKKLVLKSRKQANTRAVSTPNKTIVMRQV